MMRPMMSASAAPRTRTPDPFADEIQRRADRVCNLILYLDVPWVDIAIQIERLRDFCREQAPDKLDAFERIYESRFHRLWEQWRGGNEICSYNNHLGNIF